MPEPPEALREACDPGKVVANEQDLRDALDRISDGFIVYDRQWRFRTLNRAAERYFGRPREELLGRVVWDVFPQAVDSHPALMLRSVAERGEPVEVEAFAPAMRRWVSFRMHPAANGGVAVTFTDVTEARKSADELRASEARHRAILDHAGDAMFLTSPDGTILAANPAACRMFRRTEPEICALGRGGVVDSSDSRLSEALDARRRSGHVRAELTLRRGDGTTFPGEVSSAVFLDADGTERTSLTIRDLTDQKRAEDRLRLIADAGAVLGRTLDWKATLRDLTKLVVPRMADYCTLDLLEGDMLRRVSGAHRDSVREVSLLSIGVLGPVGHREGGIYRAARTGEAELVPEVSDDWLRGTTRDGAHLDIAVANRPRSALVVPLQGRKGVVGVLALMIVDEARKYDEADLHAAQAIADRAALAIENARLYEAALEERRLRDEVLAIVSHDLRNPLNAILLNARVLQRRSDAQELAAIERSCRRAEALIQDLLSASVTDAGAMKLERRRENVGNVVTEAVEGLRVIAAERKVRLETDVGEGLAAVQLDRHRILQVLSNLIGNALKFTPSGGRVLVEVQGGDHEVIVSVADDGAGIEPESLHHVFDRFWQGAHARRAGAGLGLAISKGIVEAHGGTISVESTPGSGSTFTFTLPASE